MRAIICGKTAVRFKEPTGKTTLKDWLNGVPDNRRKVILQDDKGETLARLEAKENPKNGQLQAKPQTFSTGDYVYSTWLNLQPDKYGRVGRYGYTLVVKRLYKREKIREESPDPIPEAVEA